MPEQEAPKFIWVFGSAVQDVAVDIDLDRLSRERADVQKLVRLDSGPEFQKGLVLRTQVGFQSFSVSLLAVGDEQKKEDSLKLNPDGFYELKPGGKCQLDDEIKEGPGESVGGVAVTVPSDYVRWGGGGVNVSVFARAIAADKAKVPIKYTDVAMSDSLQQFHQDVIETYDSLFGCAGRKPDPKAAPSTELLELLRERLSKTVVKHVPERSLETYLSTIDIDVILHRPSEFRPRRNLVISRIRGAGREVTNKIVCRGKVNPIEEDRDSVVSMLGLYSENVGAVILNSVKDRAIFEAAYLMYKSAWKKDPSTLGILAMTEPMMRYVDWMIGEAGQDGLPPHILIFNEVEFFEFAKRLAPDKSNLEPFMDSPSSPPHVERFMTLAKVVLRAFMEQHPPPRIYVTMGPQGSMGIDRDGYVLYVSGYIKPRATIFDTNACGDAYCAAIALLEWGKDHGYPNLCGQHGGTAGEAANDEDILLHKEMIYFMSVATAAAYSRATNRHGRVDSREIQDLLEHLHLASLNLVHADAVDRSSKKHLSNITDRGGRLKTPVRAEILGVTDDLRKLMSLGGQQLADFKPPQE